MNLKVRIDAMDVVRVVVGGNGWCDHDRMTPCAGLCADSTRIGLSCVTVMLELVEQRLRGTSTRCVVTGGKDDFEIDFRRLYSCRT